MIFALNVEFKHWLAALLSASLFFTTQESSGAILFGRDNSANRSNPGGGVPWDAVGKVTNATSSTVAGSAVHIGNGWVITANHVNLTSNYISFDGIISYQINPSTIQQVAPGVDLKTFRLTTIPSVTAVNLLTTSSELASQAVTVGWGVGRGPELPGTSLVTWGNDSTAAKRWGVNQIRDAPTVSGGGYTYQALRTVLGGDDGAGATYNPDGLGADESAMTLNDSGGALFQLIGGVWYLVGVTTAVELFGTSAFGHDSVSSQGRGHANYFARVSAYDTQIIAAAPEPGIIGLLALSLPLFLRRRRG